MKQITAVVYTQSFTLSSGKMKPLRTPSVRLQQQDKSSEFRYPVIAQQYAFRSRQQESPMGIFTGLSDPPLP